MQQPLGYTPAFNQASIPSTEERWKGKCRWGEPEQKQQQRETFDAQAFEREFEAVLQRDAASSVEDTIAGIGQDIQILMRDSAVPSDLEAAERQMDQLRDQRRQLMDRKGGWSLFKDRQSPQETQFMSWSQQRQREISDIFYPHFEVRAEPMHEKDGKEQQQQQQTPDGDEQLAQVAGELLDRVSDDNSDKFRNSAFLSLMRQLKEKEVKVREGAFVSRSAEEQSATEPITKHETVREKITAIRPPRSYCFAAREEGIEGGSGNRDGPARRHVHPTTPEWVTCKVWGCQ